MKLRRDPLSDLHFDWRWALTRAREVLREPPTVARIQRPARLGAIVQRFALPLELCPTTNRTRHSRPGQHEKTKEQILALLQQQAQLFQTREPLPGRPQVRCLRLSSTEPDAYSDWAKMAVDALCVPAARRSDGLGYLRDDRPKDAIVNQWWEPAKQGEGLVYIEIRAEGYQQP